MEKEEKQFERDELLADISEMYYEEGQTQAEIAKVTGKTRSAISRMLTEARQKGIVEIHIHHPLRFDSSLENELIARFPLRGAHVLVGQNNNNIDNLNKHLGRAASTLFDTLLTPNQTIGIAWGTTVSSAIDAYTGKDLLNTSVVQLVGILGSTHHRYSGQALVERLARKIKGTGVYLYTPFIVENKEAVNILLRDQSINEAITLGKNCDVALLGIGSTNPDFCSLYKGGHITKADLDSLLTANAVGDVGGHYYDIHGDLVDVEFQHRLMSISWDDLRKIPIRLGMAGHPMKAEAIIGAIRGGSINELVTDQKTALKILELSD
ncbi:MAG: sugar-binding transcriptional regulator [Bacteroidetes bacterium]|jgi:deoxyribonucleoside regulator|nr:sugar-binding transcriptional regulator [Bacteroidota bacterium]